jgi:hypothetical protein
MASIAASGPASEADPLRRVRTAAFVLLAGALAWKLGLFLLTGLWAVGDPYELDYGEGIVWQQMRMMLDGTAYGAIDGFPSIVFHYPPLYHTSTGLIAALGGFDQLAAGRALSLIATLGTAALVGLVAAKLSPADDRPVRRIVGAVAALVALSWWPVVAWAPLMRVDMLASLLAFGGLWLAMLSLDRPRLIYPAALAFVAAVYTKQTMIAAPAAVFGVLLLVRPGLALRGIASAIAAGLAVLGGLAAATDGGFVRHIFLYNVNRFDGQQLLMMGGAQMGLHALYVGAGLFALTRSVSNLRSGAGSLGGLRAYAAERPDAIRLLFVLGYGLLATPMLLMVCKVGSNINYFIEWMLVLSIFVGLAAGEAAKALLGRPGAAGSLVVALMPALLALQAMILPNAPYRELRTPAQVATLEQLSQRIAAADKPVIADDMVLLLRAGKPVLWEPAIFAELASTGFYDERPFVAKVLRRDFAFFLTFGERGSTRHDQRYTPAVADAIDAAYARKERHGRLTLHLPAER